MSKSDVWDMESFALFVGAVSGTLRSKMGPGEKLAQIQKLVDEHDLRVEQALKSPQ